MEPDNDYAKRFSIFLTNEWVHLERKVAALEAKMHLVIGLLSVLIGLVVYVVVDGK